MHSVRKADIVNDWGLPNETRPNADPETSLLFTIAKVAVIFVCSVEPDALWSLITDPTRIGEVSDEGVLGEWILPF